MEQISIAIFFLFFAFSFARTPLTQQENDITNIKLPGTLLETDATSTNQFEKETQHVQENQDHLPEPKGKKIKALPLTFVRLHPINRHFRVTSRRPSLSCHHHHHHFHHADNLKPRTQSKYLDDQIPYGNDMIPDDDDDDAFDHVFPGGLSQVPQEWMNFLHHNNDDNDDDDDEQKMSRFIIKRNNHDKFGKMKLKGRLYDPFDDEEVDEDGKISAMQHEDHHRHSFEKKKMKKHLHRHHEEEEQEDEEGNEAHREEKKGGGFVRHIRKFLDNYFD